MISEFKVLTADWEEVLTNQIGGILKENQNDVSVRVGGGDAITLPPEGFSFQTPVTVEVKNYNSQIAEIGVIK